MKSISCATWSRAACLPYYQSPATRDVMDMAILELIEPSGFDAIKANAKALRPWLATKSDEIEKLRCLPQEVVDRW